MIPECKYRRPPGNNVVESDGERREFEKANLPGGAPACRLLIRQGFGADAACRLPFGTYPECGVSEAVRTDFCETPQMFASP